MEKEDLTERQARAKELRAALQDRREGRTGDKPQSSRDFVEQDMRAPTPVSESAPQQIQASVPRYLMRKLEALRHWLRGR